MEITWRSRDNKRRSVSRSNQLITHKSPRPILSSFNRTEGIEPCLKHIIILIIIRRRRIIMIGNLWRLILWEPRALTSANKHIHLKYTHTTHRHTDTHTNTHTHTHTHTHKHTTTHTDTHTHAWDWPLDVTRWRRWVKNTVLNHWYGGGRIAGTDPWVWQDRGSGSRIPY